MIGLKANLIRTNQQSLLGAIRDIKVVLAKCRSGHRTREVSVDPRFLAWESGLYGESYLCAAELELLGETTTKEYRQVQRRYSQEDGR